MPGEGGEEEKKRKRETTQSVDPKRATSRSQRSKYVLQLGGQNMVRSIIIVVVMVIILLEGVLEGPE